MGIKLLNGIEIGDIPSTPASNLLDAEEATPVAYASIIAHSSEYGFPVGYKQEQSGRIVQNLLPIKQSENQQISSSSKSNLELHTETAFHPYKPDYLFLLCLKGDKRAATTYAIADDFLSELSESTIEILQSNSFVTSVDDSFKTDGSDTVDVTIPVLKKRWDNRWSVTYDKYAMRGMDERSQDALDKLTRAITDSLQSVILEPGQMLIIDNSQTVHGRTGFTPRYDGTDRWLLRTLVVRSLPPLSQINNRVVTTSFGTIR